MSGECDLYGRGLKNTDLWLVGLVESELLENLDLDGKIIKMYIKMDLNANAWLFGFI